MTETTTPQVSSEVKEFNLVKEFGEGHYSNAMKELYADSKRLLGISHNQALKLAHSFGVEVGRQQAHPKIAFGKKTKDGKMTLRETATMKGVTVTYSISLAKACVMLQDLRDYGATSTEVDIREDMLEWLNSKPMSNEDARQEALRQYRKGIITIEELREKLRQLGFDLDKDETYA